MSKHISYYHGGRPEVAKFLPERYSRILEIGCGDGGFCLLLTGDFEYWGVEPEPSAAQKAATHLHKVLQGSFDQIMDQLPEAYFDLVICNDVIEHMPDHDFFLQEIRKKMTPGSYLVGSIPNVRYYKNLLALLFLKDWKYTAKGILDSTHLRFFTQKSLLRIFKINGFTPERVDGLNSAVYFKKKYCTTLPRTTGNVIKYVFRFISFMVFDLITLGHSTDIKYAQIGFRIRA